MTKSEYLSALQDKLERFNRELQQEIMEDYEQHFAEGLAAGKTEGEIVEELGNIEDMIQELPEEDIKQEVQVSEAASVKKDAYEGDYSAIVINGLFADVSLEKSDDGHIYVDYRNEGDTYMQKRYRFYQYEENGTFYVGVRDCGGGERKKIMLFGKTLLSYDSVVHVSGNIVLTVRIPDGLPVVEAKTTSGDVTINRVNSGRMKLEATSGDIKVSGAENDEAELRTQSGDMIMSDMVSNRIELTASSGDMELSRLKAQTIRLQTASGEIDGHDITGKELTAGTGSGDIKLSADLEEYTIKSGSGDVELRADKAARKVKIQTGSGDVKLDLTKATDAEVHATTGSGDCVIYDANGGRHQMSFGNFTVGSGECKVAVQTGSGDAEIRCR